MRKLLYLADLVAITLQTIVSVWCNQADKILYRFLHSSSSCSDVCSIPSRDIDTHFRGKCDVV